MKWHCIFTDPPPLGQMVWLWAGAWRHAFPGQRNGDYGQCYIDTCEPEAKGWRACATHWMPMAPTPNEAPMDDSLRHLRLIKSPEGVPAK